MSLKQNVFLSLVSVILLIIINCGNTQPQQAVVKINPAQKFQTITGWEATAQAGESYSPAFKNYQDKLFDRAVDDLGINRLRIEVRSGAENPADYFADFVSKQITEEEWRAHYYEVVNDNDDPFTIDSDKFHFSELDAVVENVVLPVKKRLNRRGEALFLNLNFVDFNGWRGQSNIRLSENPEEYAEFILAAFQHLQKKYDLVPDAVEVILEPDSDTGWTGEKIGRAVVATAKRLRSNNFEPSFIAPSTTNAANAPVFIDEIARVPEAMRFITEFSYHRYCCAAPEIIERIADRAARYGKQTAMLEWIGADYNTLHEDLKIGRNSAWQQYTLAFINQPDNGAQYYLINDKDARDPKITLGSRTKLLRQYFRFIRPGAQRIGAETSNPNFSPLAFVNTNGSYVVVIKADAPGSVTVQNLPPGQYRASYTTAQEFAVTAAPDAVLKTGESLTATIPAVGVLTICNKN